MCTAVNRQFTTPSFQKKKTALALHASISLDTHFVSAFQENYFWYFSSEMGSVYVFLRPYNLDMVDRQTHCPENHFSVLRKGLRLPPGG
jgi:hypothetical protein